MLEILSPIVLTAFISAIAFLGKRYFAEQDRKREESQEERRELFKGIEELIDNKHKETDEILIGLKSDIDLNTMATKILLRDTLRSVALYWKEKHERMPQAVKDEWLRNYSVYMDMVGENGYIETLYDWVKEQ